ncbi:MAG: NfeD family protein [Bacteroides sp.]
MDILIILLLVVAGIVLFIVEVFLIPGISIAGISAAVCLIYGNYYAFANMGLLAGSITLATSVIGCITILIWFVHSKTLDKFALKKDITSTVDNGDSKTVKIGDKGKTITRLALIGNAEINSHIIEVKSMEGLINENAPIVVERIDEGVIKVRKQ